MGAKATPPLIEQWANNLGLPKIEYGSWIDTIAYYYTNSLDSKFGDKLMDIYNAISGGEVSKYGDLYQDIAASLGDEKPLNGSYLERIVKLTTPA